MPLSLYPQGKSHGTHWIRGWMGPRVILDMVVKRKFPSPHQKSNPRTPITQPIASHCSAWSIYPGEVTFTIPVFLVKYVL
jgi:hypothetical protein